MRGRQWLAAVVLLAVGLFWGLQVGVQVAIAEEMVPAFNEGLEEEWFFFPEEDLVVAASKYQQPVQQAPSSVTIITAKDIEQYGWRTLADVLRSVTGFYVTYDRLYDYAGVRGFGRSGDYNSRILILINGHPTNEGLYSSSAIGNELGIDMDMVEKIEIVRGPGSALYGTNALLAVINVITKQGEDVNGVKLSYEAGSFDWNKGILSYGHKFDNGLNLLLSGLLTEAEGQILFFEEFDDPATNNGYAEGVDEEEFGSIIGNISWGDFTLHGQYIDREKQDPAAAFEVIFNNKQNKSTDKTGYIELVFNHDFSPGNEVILKGYYDYYSFDGVFLYDNSEDAPPDELTNIDNDKSERWGLEAQVNWELFKSDYPLLKRSYVTVGASYQDYFNLYQLNFDQETGDVWTDDDRSYDTWSFYIQDTHRLWDNLTLVLGLRYDEYPSIFGGEVNPRASLIYSLLEKTTLKLLYGEAFRAPNVYELYYNDGGWSIKDNPNLEPEKIETYEFVWEQNYLRGFSSTLSAYYYEVEHLINQVEDPTDGLLQFVNEGKIEAKGLELGLRGEWEGIRGRAGIAWQETEDKQTGNELIKPIWQQKPIMWING